MSQQNPGLYDFMQPSSDAVAFPPLPRTLGEVLQVLSRAAPVPETERLIEIIERDPATTAYVLRRANSAYYAPRREIAQAERAVVLLGFREVCNLVLMAGLKHAFAYLEEPRAKVVFEHLMRTSVATAAFARDLARHLSSALPETTYTTGLMYQMGRMVLLHDQGAAYVDLWFSDPDRPDTQPSTPELKVERERFGTDTAERGAAMAEAWGMPEDMAEVIRHQSTPERLEYPHVRTIADIVGVSFHAARALFDAEPPSEHLRHPHLDSLQQQEGADSEEVLAFLSERGTVVRDYAVSSLTG